MDKLVPADIKPTFGELEYTNEEKSAIGNILEQKLGANEVAFRTGAGSQSVGYLEAWRAIELANEIFGYDGWSSSVINLSQDFLEGEGQRFSCGISAVVRVQLKDGSFHEDVGYGTADNMKKGLAIEKAKKEAISDALKRALRLFGNRLGNSVYDKEHMKANQAQQKANQATARQQTFNTNQTNQVNKPALIPAQPTPVQQYNGQPQQTSHAPPQQTSYAPQQQNPYAPPQQAQQNNYQSAQSYQPTNAYQNNNQNRYPGPQR
ncbi:hypothetical protein PROFUN_09085 [Planoprotostelium fungivorum]|uniref:Uncharacterized protein n=1 Tax=Planoprotostelium fungivorum TaxID=1890364 RepID=A0A2P6NIG4_9EUKA|nr:hypothetical protein PROFUN_09085 [Planoprotostelium fungivorum]